MTTDERTPYYRPLAVALWRASAWGADQVLPPWPGEAADAATWRCWLAQVWAIRPLAEAITLASPSLADRVEQALIGRQYPTAELRRMATSLARYLVRARGRATPFGAFAGVGPIHFGDHAYLWWSGGHRLRARADPVWLASVIARFEGCVPLLERLPVVVNDLAAPRGGRLVVPWQPHLDSAMRGGGEDVVEVSVRLIPILRTITAIARTPIPTGALIDKAAAEYPGATHGAMVDLVGQLVASGVLISSLRAPGTCTNPLGRLIGELETAGAETVPDVEPLLNELRTIHRELQNLGRTKTRNSERDRRLATGRMRAISTASDQPVAVDLHLGATLVLPSQVADEAAATAEALIRLTLQPSANASWHAFHRDFLARYGPGTLVPVTELTDPARGLGYPCHFTTPPIGREVTRRDEALLALAQQAALDDSHEITLDEAALDLIAPVHDGGWRPVTATDVSADLRASSQAALDRGEFTLEVSGFGRTGATTGRFLDLLDKNEKNRFTALYASLPTGVHGALAAQLSFPPQRIRSENVLRVAPVLPYVIPLAEHHGQDEGLLPVADLAVAADAARLYVVSCSRRRVVEPMLPHAGARHTMPPLARLLFEIPRSTHPAVTAFDWGIAACLPKLPRVRYGRSFLVPAQWRLAPSDQPGPRASADEWAAAVQKMRETRSLPATVSVGDGDRRLRLDLDEPMDLAVLRDHLQAADGSVTVAEAPARADYSWCGGRAHEIVIPLAATAPPDPAPVFLSSTMPPPIADLVDRTGVVFVKLYGPSEAADEILTRFLPMLLEQWDTPPRWWFVRYRHPAPHLRLRLHDTDYAKIAGAMAAWAQCLRRRGLVGEIAFDTYRPETGRYGTGATMDAAETLFAADSAAVLAQLAFLAAHQGIPTQALTAASLVDLAVAVTGDHSTGLRWLLDHPEHANGAPKQDRGIRRHTLHLTQGGVLQALSGGADLATTWSARADAAADYATRLKIQGSRLTPETVLGSLLHLHHIRAYGIDPGAEATTYKLARAVALAYTARHTDRQHKGGGR